MMKDLKCTVGRVIPDFDGAADENLHSRCKLSSQTGDDRQMDMKIKVISNGS